jgi:tetratricopeptide (TPR) repeat protein
MPVKTRKFTFFFILFVVGVLVTNSVLASGQDDRIRRAQIFIQSENYKEAVNILEKIVEQSPADADASYLLGLAYVGAGESEKAESQFRKVINIVPDFEGSYIQLASILAGKKDFDGAARILDSLKIANPKSPWEPYARGVLMYMQQKLPEALAEFNRAKTADPTFTSAYANLGYIYYNERKFDEALDNFRQASLNDPNNPEFPFASGWTYLKMGKRTEALRCFREASSIKAPHVYSAMEKVLTSYYGGNLESAEKALEEVFNFVPDFSRGLYMKAKIQVDRKNFREAEKLLNKMLESDPIDGDARELMNEIKPHLSDDKD